MEEGMLMLVAIITGVLVLGVAGYFVYIQINPGVGTIDMLGAKARCDELCVDDNMIGSVNLGGVCAYSDKYKFSTTFFNVGGSGRLSCNEISICHMSAMDGRCVVNEDVTNNMEESCRLACIEERGSYTSVIIDKEPAPLRKLCDMYTLLGVNCGIINGQRCVSEDEYFESNMC